MSQGESRRMTFARRAVLTGLGALLLGCGPADTTPRVRIPVGAGGVGFLPLLLMREHRLIEKHAAAAGLTDLTVEWIDLGGPSVMNDALISGSVDFISHGSSTSSRTRSGYGFFAARSSARPSSVHACVE